MAQLDGYDPFERSRRLTREAGRLDPVSRSQYLDTLQYLPADILTKVDRMSMANSLEVRAPLLDYTLVEYVATLPVSLKLRGTLSKYLLRRVGERLLPAATLTKAKQGFGIPKDLWFRKTLRPFAEEILLDRRSLARGYFRKDALTRMLRHHATGRRDYSTWIWSLIVLETWCRLFLDAPAAGITGAGRPRRDRRVPDGRLLVPRADRAGERRRPGRVAAHRGLDPHEGGAAGGGRARLRVHRGARLRGDRAGAPAGGDPALVSQYPVPGIPPRARLAADAGAAGVRDAARHGGHALHRPG